MIEQDRIEFERWWNSQPFAFKKLLPSMEASNLVWVESARKTRAMCTTAPLPDEVAQMVERLLHDRGDKDKQAAAYMIERLARQVPPSPR